MNNTISLAEKVILVLLALLVLGGFALSYLDHDFFKDRFAVEDGVVEWLTVLALAATMVVCFRRVWLLRGKCRTLFLVMTALLGLAFLFGAGEEISWGQRIFNIESTEFFQQNNAQGETNLHNIVIYGVKINKLVFGKGIGIALLLYLAVLVPLYRRKVGVRGFFDRIAAPMPTNYQIIAYVIVLLLIQVLMVSSKKGELLEAALATVFFLNIAFPYNRQLFEADSVDTVND